MNAKNDLAVAVLVDPVNDPPFIQVPENIVLTSDGNESQIFNREINKFNFCIGDPDAFNYPGMCKHIFLLIFGIFCLHYLCCIILRGFTFCHFVCQGVHLNLQLYFPWKLMMDY